MAHSEMKNAPPLHGWAIAVAAGAVASAISFLVVGIEGNGSVAIGAVIALVVGVIFTIAESPAKPTPKAGSVRQVTAAAKTPTTNREKVSQGSEPVVAPAMDKAVSGGPSATTAAEPVSGDAMEPGVQGVPADTPVAGSKPTMLTAAIGAPDDLKQISGVGPVLESKLNDLGVYHFWQIARWSAAEVAWVDDAISFKGRITRDDWITQASKLAATSPAKPPA